MRYWWEKIGVLVFLEKLEPFQISFSLNSVFSSITKNLEKGFLIVSTPHWNIFKTSMFCLLTGQWPWTWTTWRDTCHFADWLQMGSLHLLRDTNPIDITTNLWGSRASSFREFSRGKFYCIFPDLTFSWLIVVSWLPSEQLQLSIYWKVPSSYSAD